MHHLRFRQIHLDFHTSPAIPGIGEQFDKHQWQDALKRGHVDSITTFSKCHHGWSYHPTSVGQIHPNLSFDLLRAQFDAAKEIGVNVPVYLSAGVDNLASYEHPEWREVGPDGAYTGWAKSPVQAGFHMMCFNSPYLDYLCEQIREAVRLFPTCDGIFLDIIAQGQCCCRWCLEKARELGLDMRAEAARLQVAGIGMTRYYEQTTAASKVDDAAMPVFHNSGHIKAGQRELLKYFSHLELESLPTGGWGYDHFPMSAKYCTTLDHDFLGMTGKFHTTWGEFGGYKHPNALRYECAAMLAYGSKCSIGDQLHPNGVMDASTYDIIGAAYSEVETKEPWCDHVRPISDIGLLSSAAVTPQASRDCAPDTGAGRVLLEGKFLFDILDQDADFAGYKVLVLPDNIPVEGNLKTRLDAYLAAGGKLFMTGSSGICPEGGFAFDSMGAQFAGGPEYELDYVLPSDGLRASFCNSPMVMYVGAQRIRVTDGHSLGEVYDPYFDRDYRHFCSHQHTPPRPEPSGFDAGVYNGTNILYLVHPVFSLYRSLGAVAYKEYAINCLNLLLGDDIGLRSNMPSTARVSLMEQPAQNRAILHLLYANTINRGGEMQMEGGNLSSTSRSVEVIEELEPLTDVALSVKLSRPVKAVTREPQGAGVPFRQEAGRLNIALDGFVCHEMLVFHYAD